MRVGLCLGLVLLIGCGDDDMAPPDLGACAVDSDCDDGVYCNGDERCVGGGCVAPVMRCQEEQICDELLRRCLTECSVTEDADGDGSRAVECGGNDCDDSNPSRFPGNTEVCDLEGLDEDCDPMTFGFRDADGDGSPDGRCCNTNPADDTTTCGGDCDDAAPGANPSNPEVCNDIDDDCDGMVDEGLRRVLTIDADGDGHGDASEGATTMLVCNDMAGFAALADDCDDTDPNRFPGNPELCDDAMVDEDCSGEGNDVEGGCACTGDESRTCGELGRCAGATQQCTGGRWGPCAVVPATEVCDGSVDEDCDGMVDEELTAECWADGDGDTFASGSAVRMDVCRSSNPGRQDAPYNGCPPGMTGRAPGAGTVDCCDADLRVRPDQTSPYGTPSNCGGFDFNCDGRTVDGNPDYDRTSDCAGYGSIVEDCRTNASGIGNGWQGTIPPNCGDSGGFCTNCWINPPGTCYSHLCFSRPRDCI